MTDSQDDFKLDRLSLGDQFVELGFTSRTQNGLVEVEQCVSSDGDLLASRLRATRSSTNRSRLGRCRVANINRDKNFLISDIPQPI
jgi:hypothetical protein